MSFSDRPLGNLPHWHLKSEAMGYILWSAVFILGCLEAQRKADFYLNTPSAHGETARAKRGKMAFTAPALTPCYSASFHPQMVECKLLYWGMSTNYFLPALWQQQKQEKV